MIEQRKQTSGKKNRAESDATPAPANDSVFDTMREAILAAGDARAERRKEAEIKAQILIALHAHWCVPAAWIDFSLKGGWVTLTGFVRAPYQAKAAKQTVSRVPGVTGVIDELIVTGA